MDLQLQINRLEIGARAIQALVGGYDEVQVRWRPDPDSWSVLEVINHLYDEEREDFREHLDLVLNRPGDRWTRIDPEGWVLARSYNSRDFGQSLADFLAERRISLEWLAGLSNPDWEAAFELPWGSISAGDLLASWVAHDILHMRQLVELRWALGARESQPFSGRYAGDWEVE